MSNNKAGPGQSVEPTLSNPADDLKRFNSLEKQIADLEIEKENLKKSLRKNAIDSVKATIQKFALTAKELGFSSVDSPKSTTPKAPPVVRYRNEKGETWAGPGSRGAKPNWVKAIEADKTKNIEDYAVK